MKKVFSFIMLGLCLLIGSVVLTGCSTDSTDKITVNNVRGEWYVNGDADKKVTLSQTESIDGGLVTGEIDGIWLIYANVLTVTWSEGAHTGTLSNAGKTLTLTFGSSTVILTREIDVSKTIAPIIGTWIISQAENPEEIGVYYIFRGASTDGTVVLKAPDGVVVTMGKWSLSGKAMTMDFGDVIESEISFSNNNNTLTIFSSEANKTIVFTRDVNENVTTSIVGTWEVTDTENPEEIGVLYVFSGASINGTVTLKAPDGEVGSMGTWSLNNTTLFMVFGDVIEAEIYFSNSNTLTLFSFDSGKIVTLIRQ